MTLTLRKLSDLPWEGLPVRVQLRTRRFFCVRPECSQTIFAERLPATVVRYGRRTCRLSRAYSLLAMALGGEAGARLAIELGIKTSGDSLRALALRKDIALLKPMAIHLRNAHRLRPRLHDRTGHHGAGLFNVHPATICRLLARAGGEAAAGKS